MGSAEGAGRPPRIAQAPARSGRSRPPGSDTSDATAPSGPVQTPRDDSEVDEVEAPLDDSEVDEVEQELTDDDLWSPADPAERARVQNAQRRLVDHALVKELAAVGFEGPVFDVAVTEFASYAIAVLMAWMRTGQIFGKCKAKGRPASGSTSEWSRDDRLEIAVETTARALKYFLGEVLAPGKWDHRRGATLKTFFIGACLLQFPNEFDRWAREQRRWGQPEGEQALEHAVVRGNPHWADPTGDAAVRACTLQERLAEIPDRQTRQAAWLVNAYGASHAEAGEVVGLSADGVEGRLYRLRHGRPK